MRRAALEALEAALPALAPLSSAAEAAWAEAAAVAAAATGCDAVPRSNIGYDSSDSTVAAKCEAAALAAKRIAVESESSAAAGVEAVARNRLSLFRLVVTVVVRSASVAADSMVHDAGAIAESSEDGGSATTVNGAGVDGQRYSAVY